MGPALGPDEDAGQHIRVCSVCVGVVCCTGQAEAPSRVLLQATIVTMLWMRYYQVCGLSSTFQAFLSQFPGAQAGGPRRSGGVMHGRAGSGFITGGLMSPGSLEED